jgi:TolA-binding protein
MENIQEFTFEERYQEGLKYIQSRNYDKAEKVFYEILKNSPNHINSLFLMGFSLYEQKKNSIALTYLGKASMLKKNFRDADYFIGKIYKNIKQLNKAKQYFNKILKEYPNDLDALISLVTTKIDFLI